MKFLVLGLPRSRTAWLANFLTYGDLFCYHDGTNGCNSIDEYKEKTKGKGDSNTGLMLFDYTPHFPTIKTIVIDSDIDRSVDFAQDIFNINISSGMKEAKNTLNKTKGLHVKLEDINDRLNEIWDYVSNKEFDKERAEILVKMDIQSLDPHDINYRAIENFSRSMNASLH